MSDLFSPGVGVRSVFWGMARQAWVSDLFSPGVGVRSVFGEWTRTVRNLPCGGALCYHKGYHRQAGPLDLGTCCGGHSDGRMRPMGFVTWSPMCCGRFHSHTPRTLPTRCAERSRPTRVSVGGTESSAAELKDWVVNNWIGRYTAELTGRKRGEQVPSRSGLIRWYRKLHRDGGPQAVSTVDFEPLTIGVPLREDPPGVFRVGDSRVLLELVLDAFRRGESAEAIVRSYRTLRLADVYAVISRYLADPAPFDEYLRRCDEEAAAVRREMDAAGMTGGVGNEELLERTRSKGLIA